MTSVFRRATASLPVAVRAEGVWIEDSAGKRYLDAAGGAIVVSLGHGDPDVVRVLSEQAGRVDYVHGTQFTTEVLEAYAAELAEVLPMDSPRVYPVSGGSEAVETALKLARAYHLARGDDRRHRIVARWGSYHGNTRGALDASGREPLRRPYEPWLGQALHVPPAYEYRCPMPSHPDGCGAAHAEALDRAIVEAGPDTVAAFIAEPVAGATLGAAVPPDDYWPAVAEVCRRHGILLIADEVMTGFGRTGRWFASDHWGMRPDILTAGKGASSGYWSLGLCVASGDVHDTVMAKGFVHGFTYSHHAIGAAVGRAVLTKLRDHHLVERSRELGERLLKELTAALEESPHVGDVRGLGTMIGVEIVSARSTKEPFPRAERATERIVAAAKGEGLLLYSSTGCADGTNGDLVMVGPPFTLTDDEADLVIERAVAAIGTLQA
jgi:adenosylmethionine-8-amino-7-oxononanoate aminotransferase